MQNKPHKAEVAAVMPPHVTLDEEHGYGGYKVVYRATVNGSIEAIKIVRIPVDPDDPSVERTNRRRLERELGLLSKCQSPYLVKLGQLSPVDIQIGDYGYVCYSEELLDGSSLRQEISTGSRPTQSELAGLAGCLLLAVAELIQHDAVHRDIKPNNIVRTTDPERPYVLLDLGIAFIVGGTGLTIDTQAIPGTRFYTAPEMLDAGFRGSLDYRADLYTIGLTLYEYASGQNPFANRTDPPETTMYRIKHLNPQPLSVLRSDLDVDLCKLVDGLIRKLPALRPSNMAILTKKMEGYK